MKVSNKMLDDADNDDSSSDENDSVDDVPK